MATLPRKLADLLGSSELNGISGEATDEISDETSDS
jgi:hypothetical protein